MTRNSFAEQSAGGNSMNGGVVDFAKHVDGAVTTIAMIAVRKTCDEAQNANTDLPLVTGSS
jgi:hypothetical protein